MYDPLTATCNTTNKEFTKDVIEFKTMCKIGQIFPF